MIINLAERFESSGVYLAGPQWPQGLGQLSAISPVFVSIPPLTIIFQGIRWLAT